MFVNSIATVFKDARLVVFLGIFSCFWLMFMQLWDLLPNFIDEWVDTSDVAPWFAAVSESWVQADGQTKPEMIINLNPMAIVILVVFVSAAIGRINKVAAMVVGMLISLVGFVGAGATSIGFFCCALILVFTVGEMTCSPTFNAYVGLIAPPGKKALYMGYANIPFAIGWALGNKIGGNLYESTASKYNLARDYLVQSLGMDPAFVHHADKLPSGQGLRMLPNEQVMNVMVQAGRSGEGVAIQERLRAYWELVDWSALGKDEVPGMVDLLYAQVVTPADAVQAKQATQILWDMHQPQMVWYYLGIIGLVGTIGMIAFYFFTKKPSQSGDEKPAASADEPAPAEAD